MPSLARRCDNVVSALIRYDEGDGAMSAKKDSLQDYEPLWGKIAFFALLFLLIAFAFAKFRYNYGYERRVKFVGLWLLALYTVGIVSAIIAAYRRGRARKRRANNLCVACGYDLRASKDRCPECGTAVPAGHTPEVGR
jgi:hypothetical protein